MKDVEAWLRGRRYSEANYAVPGLCGLVILIEAALAQDREERGQRPDIAYHEGLMDGKADPLAAKLERLAEKTNKGDRWIWLDTGLTLVHGDVFGLSHATPEAAADAALEEVEGKKAVE